MDRSAVTAGGAGAGPSPDRSWTEPGAFAVAPGVHRIPLPLPNDALRAVNVYAIEDGDTLVLIDSGWALTEARVQLEAALAVLGRELGDVTRFLITHVHRDHYTQGVVLRREFGTRLSLGLGERPSLELSVSGRHIRLEGQVGRLRRAGAAPIIGALRAAFPARLTKQIWELPDDWLDGPGDITLRARTLTPLPTPGHTRGHLVFRDGAAGLLFAGDHVLPHITPSIGFEPAPAASPLADYLQSLRLVRQLPDTALLPAHGPVTPSVHTRVDELLAHHAARLDASLRAVERGAATAYEVARQLTWTRRDRVLGDLDPFNQMLAVLETAAHLEVLVMQDRLVSETVDEVAGYRLR
jgi:glyoxylase-like metal-dependent hydrolase (beta-lactamase superfamily II)